MRMISDKKIKSFESEMERLGVEVSIFLNSEPIFDSNIEYFTGFKQDKYHSFSCLLIEKGEMTLITSRLDYERALKEVKNSQVINKKDFDNSLVKILREKLKGKKVIGINENLYPYILYRKFKSKKYVDVSEIAYKLRSVKEQKEVEIIKKASKITNYGLKILKENLSRKISEKELGLILEHELIKKGADGFSFSPIIKTGESAAYIHPYPGSSEQKIKRGLGLIDFGIIYKGYCTDTTVPLKIGKLNSKETLISKAVEEAYQESIESLKIGIPGWKIFEVARKIIESYGFEFKHCLGHGIGLDVHELPNLCMKPESEKDLKKWKEEILKENMVFTIEPGIYVPEIGGYRIENDILLTKKGPEVLTKSKPIIL